MAWFLYERKFKILIDAFGNGIVNGMGSTALIYSFSFLGVFFNLDTLFFLSDFEPGNNFHTVTVIFRISCHLVYTHCCGRNMAFLLLFYIITFQAYISCFTLVPTKYASSCAIVTLREYLKIVVVHTRLYDLANVATAWLVFMGHTTCLIMFWMGIRGWSFIPAELNTLFPVFGMNAALCLIVALTVQSHIGSKSVRILKILRRRRYCAFLEKRLKATRAVHFRIGGLQRIGKESTGNFVNTLSGNLSTAVLTF